MAELAESTGSDVSKINALETLCRKHETTIQYLQTERASILSFWDITKNRLAKAQDTIIQDSLEHEEILNGHLRDLNAYRHRLRNLVIDHCNREATSRDNYQTSLAQQETTLHTEYSKTKATHNTALEAEHTARLAAEQTALQSQLDHENKLTEASKQFELQLAELQSGYEAKWEAEFKLMHDSCAKNIRQLESERDAAFTDLRQQHQTSIQSLLTTTEAHQEEQSQSIAALQEQNVNLTESEVAAQRQCRSVTGEFAGLNLALNQVQQELSQAKKQLEAEKTDASILGVTKKRLAAVEKRNLELKVENEALLEKLQRQLQQ